MKKERVTINQIIAGALLKFGKLDSVDISLLIDSISNVCEVVNDTEPGEEYFLMADGSVILNYEYINRMHSAINNTRLERIQGDIVKKYLDNLVLEEFVLRKIKLLGLGCVPKDDIIHSFSVNQIYALCGLHQDRCVGDYCHKDSVYGDYEAIMLTKRGELYLFLSDNKRAVESFVKRLKINGYNELLLDAFLITQDLQQDAKDILKLDRFVDFCDEYGKTTKTSGYSRVRIPKKTII